jgi:hypothetical protein
MIQDAPSDQERATASLVTIAALSIGRGRLLDWRPGMGSRDAGARRAWIRVVVVGALGALLAAPDCLPPEPQVEYAAECSYHEDGNGCCADGVDNDGDAKTDCDDKDCRFAPPCQMAELQCQDGIDNDADGDADCADADCDGAPQDGGVCEFPSETTCNDGVDNDGDDLLDCADPNCAASCSGAEDCGNKIDDNGNGFFDCNDPACIATASCGIESSCNDAADNDGDGATDCNDIGCAQAANCLGEVICNDGIDNDGDAATDFQEVGCNWLSDLLFCAPGRRLHGYRVAQTLVIPDGGSVTQTINIPLTGSVEDYAMTFTILHTFVEDLDVTLTRPGGTPQDVTSDNGGSGDNYASPLLIDSMGTPITSGTPPFSGPHRPETPFSTYVYGPGRTLSGTWTLTITDDNVGETGMLTNFMIGLCVHNGPPS